MGTPMLMAAVTALALHQTVSGDFPPPRELFTLSWTGGPLVWPSATVRAMYRASGRLEPSNMLATRAAIFRYVRSYELPSGPTA